jgi:hypothetical protein
MIQENDSVFVILGVGRHEDDPAHKVGMLGLDLSVERRSIHRGHAKVAEDQIVDVGADVFERLLPVGNRVDLAEPVAPHQPGDELAQEHVIVNHKYARTLKTSHMDIPIRAPISRLALGKLLAADRTDGVSARRHGRRPPT